MRLKQDRYSIIRDLEARVMCQVNNELNALSYNAANISMNELKARITNAIASGVSEGMKTLLDNLYTDDDFENDLNLKS